MVRRGGQDALRATSTTRSTPPCRARRAACPTRRFRACTPTWTTTTNALERARTLIGVEDRRTVDSLQCLPLSPFAERQPPHCSRGAVIRATQPRPPREPDEPRALRRSDVPKRFRNPDDAVDAEGRAFQVDATCADVAIMREPLVPCVAITSPQDCIFGQSQPFLTSVLGAAAALSRLARAAFQVAHPDVAGGRARARGALFVHAAQELLRRARVPLPPGRVALLGRHGRRAAQLDLHERARDGRRAHRAGGNAKGPPRAPSGCARRPRGEAPSARRFRTS